MTPATKTSPVSGCSADTGTSDPTLVAKDGTVIHIMPHLAALWRKRHATRDRLDRIHAELVGLSAQSARVSLILGATDPCRVTRLPQAGPEPDHAAPPWHPEADVMPLGAADDVMLAGWSLDLWPGDEYQHITADGDLQPVMDGPVFTCWCGAQSSGGSCPLGHRS